MPKTPPSKSSASKKSTSSTPSISTHSSTAHKRKTLVLLDSHAIIHRAYHALPEFASSKGVPTGALYGLTTMLLGIIEKFKPEYIVACYDLPEPTYRHLAYEGYKAGRKKTDSALVEQLESSRSIFQAFGVPIFDHPGFEADDMLGTIVEQVIHDTDGNPHGKDDDGTKIKVVIASGDMDTMQLVTGDDVVVYTLKKGIKDIVIYDELAVIERFGFKPEFLPDYKGLRGDPSDNIIGIAGIGEKTASIIINTFGTIEGMYEVLDKNPEDFRKKLKDVKITDRVIGLLENGRDDALFSKTLATIRRDAPIKFNYEDAKWTPHMDQIEELFKELEFRTLAARVKRILDGGSSGELYSADATAHFSKSQKNMKNMKNENKVYDGGDDGADDADSGADESSPLYDEDGNMVEGSGGPGGKGSKKAQGKDLFTKQYYQDASDELQKKLKVAVWVYDSNKTNPTLDDVYAETGEEDAEKAYAYLVEKIEERGMGFILNYIELPLIQITDEMTAHGAMIDKVFLKKLSTDYHAELSALEKKIHKEAGMEFNIASPKQLGEVLYDKLGLGGAGSGKRIKKTAGGAKSTKESELEKLKDAHPIIAHILAYRELAKLLGTYIDVFPELADDSSRIHATFMQAGAATGRMSSLDPNLQNIPIKSELGRMIRHGFIAPKGKKLVAIDYSQFELRIAAILSGDKNLIDIFKNGIDVHTGVASRVFKVPEDQVTKDMRRKAKVINFGILYGMGVNALRQNLSAGASDGQGATREEAQLFYSEYFNTFTGIATYLEEVKRSAAALGYTKTLFGRRRYFEGIKSRLPFIKAAAERMAINAPIQGTQADIAKLAMKAVHDAICSHGENGATLILQIHDELVFEIDADKAEKVSEEIKQVMQNVLAASFVEYKKAGGVIGQNDGALAEDISLVRRSEIEDNLKQVPILVSVSIGDNWGEMK